MVSRYGIDPDAEDVDDEVRFQEQFPADNSLMGSLSSGTAAPATVGGTPDTAGNSFTDWWNKDDTQEKVHGILGALGATFGGLAGLPLGGGDTSSLERGAVRAAMAPGQARQMIREKQFTRYIDAELGKATTPGRREMLMAIRANPLENSKYLAMETPRSKAQRATDLADLNHQYRMVEIGLRNEGRLRGGGVTANRADDIGTANQLFYSLNADDQKALRDQGRIPRPWIMNPAAINSIPHLYSPNGGTLGTKTGELPTLDLQGSVDYTDPETGEQSTIGVDDWLQQNVLDRWDSMTEAGRAWWDVMFKANELKTSDEAQDVRERSGLE